MGYPNSYLYIKESNYIEQCSPYGLISYLCEINDTVEICLDFEMQTIYFNVKKVNSGSYRSIGSVALQFFGSHNSLYYPCIAISPSTIVEVF